MGVLTLVTTGCGRSYHIKGRVLLLPELQSATGFITELTGRSFPLGGTPIAGAKVTMFHDLDDANKPKRGTVWQHETTTDENGYFDTSDYAAPTKESKVGLEVSIAGYQTVYTTYIDYNDVEPQVFFIVLVSTKPTPTH
jgi:hypothetical protein